MSGSLYYSNFGDPVWNLQHGLLFPLDSGFVPCHLCWFARILMYPIVMISLIGLIKRDNRFTDYVLGLAIPGLLLASYQYVLQKVPTVGDVVSCSITNPCSSQYVNYFGFMTIPLLAVLGFLVIVVFSIWNSRISRK